MAVEIASAPVAKPAGKLRLWILVVLFLAFMVAYFDRANVAVLVADHGFTDALGVTGDKASMGLSLTSFLLLYGLTSFFAGAVIQRIGAKKTLGWCMILWAILMLVMGSVSSFAVFIMCRTLLGIAEAVTGPVSSKLIQTWFPVQERAKANSAWFVGILLANITAMPLIAGLVSGVGWRGTFYFLFALGLIPIIACFALVYDSVSLHPRVTNEEADYISAGRVEGSQSAAGNRGGFRFLKKSNFWLMIIANSMLMGCSWGILAWLPTYLKATLGFSWGAMGGLAGLPWAVAAIAVLVSSPIMDKMNSRAVFTTIGTAGVTVMLYLTTVATDSVTSIAAICLALSCSSVATVSIYVMLQNIIEPNEVATATGFLTAFGYTFASLFPYLMGAIYNTTGKFTFSFYLLVSLGMISIGASIPLCKRRL